jgi:hypothetical protein
MRILDAALVSSSIDATLGRVWFTVRATADAGSIPAASTSGFKPNMDRDNRYIPRVIEKL